METKSNPHGRVKARALAAFRFARLEALEAMARSGKGVWQHHALYINRDGVELIPGKWYHTDETYTEIYGPYNSEVEANLAMNAYLSAEFLEA